VVLLAERAAVAAVEGHVPAGHTTVGYRVQLDHLAPVAVGESVTAEAVLETIEGRRLTFRVSVKYRSGLVAAGRITRVAVEQERFLQRAAGTG
jgi:predicted thioesterase